MKKTTQYSVAIKMLLILNICGLIFLGASVSKGNQAAQEKSGHANQAGKANSAWASIFPDGLMDSNGVDVSLDRLEGKIIGLYFSASWCGPCHRFTPHLVKFQNQHKDHFEVILVGRDSVKEKQLEYMKQYNMAFPSTKWANGRNAQSDNLGNKYKVNAIPRLVILSSEGQLIMDNARNDIQSAPENITELFTNKQKLDELLEANAKILAAQAETDQTELQNKIKRYNKALQERFPRLGQDHKTTRIAHYTFDSSADDSLRKSPAFTLENTTYQDGALNLNSIYSSKDNGYKASVFLADLYYTQFSIGQEFLIRERSNVNRNKAATIIVGGKSYRWFGLKCNWNGEMELFLNNGRFSCKIPDAKVNINEWNRVLTSVDLHQGIIKVWLNGKLLPEVKLPEDFMLDVIDSTAIDRDKSFHFINYSNRETLDGLVDNLVIYDGSLTDTEITREAASFGSR